MFKRMLVTLALKIHVKYDIKLLIIHKILMKFFKCFIKKFLHITFKLNDCFISPITQARF